METWAVAIRKRREQLKISQEEFALRAQISQSLVSQVERGVTHPLDLSIARFSRHLNTLHWSVKDFMQNTGVEVSSSLVPLDKDSPVVKIKNLITGKPEAISIGDLEERQPDACGYLPINLVFLSEEASTLCENLDYVIVDLTTRNWGKFLVVKIGFDYAIMEELSTDFIILNHNHQRKLIQKHKEFEVIGSLIRGVKAFR